MNKTAFKFQILIKLQIMRNLFKIRKLIKIKIYKNNLILM